MFSKSMTYEKLSNYMRKHFVSIYYQTVAHDIWYILIHLFNFVKHRNAYRTWLINMIKRSLAIIFFLKNLAFWALVFFWYNSISASDQKLHHQDHWYKTSIRSVLPYLILRLLDYEFSYIYHFKYLDGEMLSTSNVLLTNISQRVQ